MGEAVAITIPGYTVAERIGAGGFGEVLRARHDVIGREVAIKVLHAKYSTDPEAVARFVAEARAVSRLSHAGIVDLFEFGQLADGRQYCVMELIRGTTLRDVLRDRERLPLAEAAPILRGIAEAVDAAHAGGIAHRDLKPDNVFVLEGGGVKLIDFGLAKLTRDDPSTTPVTQTGSVFGTPLYMSPEQCRGRAVDLRTDAYSFGALAYHVLTGEPPFTGDALELALHHLNDEPVAPSKRCGELDARVDRVLLALLAKDPADRPAPLVPVIAALTGDGALPAAPRRGRRGLWIVGGLLVAAAAGVIAWRVGARPADDCVTSTQRLAGAWDPQVRGRVGAVFARSPRPDVAATWRLLAADMDDYSQRWAHDWDAACHSDERKTDPLLYAQRTTCLENALLDLQTRAATLAKLDDPVAFTMAFAGSFGSQSLRDCDTVTVLRAQVPAPPAKDRDAITRAYMKLWEARDLGRLSINAQRDGFLDRSLDQLAQVTAELDALHSPVAAVAAMWRGNYLESAGSRELARVPAAREAVAKGIELAQRYRHDRVLGTVYLQLARIELGTGGTDAAIDDAISRADDALARAGHPALENGLLVQARAQVALRRHDLVAAEKLLAEGTVVFERVNPVATALDPRDLWIDVLSRLGRHDDALREARHAVVAATAQFGEVHHRTADAHQKLAQTLARAGRIDDALAELDRVEAIYAQVQPDARKYRSLYSDRAATAARGDRSDVLDHVGARSVADWLGIATTAMMVGSVVVADAALTRAAAADTAEAPPADREARLELAAYVAFMRDDTAAAYALAEQAMAVAAPHQGPAVPLRPYLSFVTRHAAIKPADPAGEGWLAVAKGDWKAARTALARARDATQPRSFDRAEIGAWLGHAIVQSGDPVAAIPILEDALAAADDCCEGFTYAVPIAKLALARALGETKGSAERARSLAGEARAGFERLGRRADRDAAAAWLAVH